MSTLEILFIIIIIMLAPHCVLMPSPSPQGELTDRDDVLDWLMTQENVMPRLNSRVLSPPSLLLDLTENMGQYLPHLFVSFVKWQDENSDNCTCAY